MILRYFFDRSPTVVRDLFDNPSTALRQLFDWASRNLRPHFGKMPKQCRATAGPMPCRFRADPVWITTTPPSTFLHDCLRNGLVASYGLRLSSVWKVRKADVLGKRLSVRIVL